MGQRDAGLAVDAGMVHLGVETDPSARETADQVELPQRSRAVEHARVESRGHLFQLPVGAGPRQHHFAEMVIEVDRAVLDPGRCRDAERDRSEPAAKHVGEMQTAGDMPPDVLKVVAVISGRQFDLVQGADMHRRLRRFEVQKRAVQSAQMLQKVSSNRLHAWGQSIRA